MIEISFIISVFVVSVFGYYEYYKWEKRYNEGLLENDLENN